MLDVFERNKAIEQVNDYDQGRRATLAAALLHDIGHGPYSHVFEEVSQELGVKKNHEAYTLELFETPEIRDPLTKFGVFESAKQFFEKESGLSVFNAIISSQLDCDRLDFLARDRHHTGIRSAALDLEWLFDSLSIEKVILDDAGDTSEYSFVFSEKGLAVAEEFVIAYMKMYENVYFHKTTRGVQHLVKDLLIDVFKNYSDRPEIRALPIATFFKSSGKLEAYQLLDDSSILAVVHIASASDWNRSTELAKRFLYRQPYKCFELPTTSTGNIGRNKLDKFRTALLEQKIYFIEDIVSHRSYKQHAVTDKNFLKNILIKKSGEHESLGNVSAFLKTPAQRVARVYFQSDEDREKARSIFLSL